MAYDDNETSPHASNFPVELYEFRHGVVSQRFTSADENKTPSAVAPLVYAAEFIERTDISQTEEINKSDITITVHRTNAIAQLYIGRPPDQPVLITIRRYHETGAAEEDVVTAWMGRVLGCAFTGNRAEMTCESVFTSLKQPGLRRRYQASCPHILYGSACGADKFSFELYTVVNAIDATDPEIIQVNGANVKADDYYAGGFINWIDAAGNQQSRAIQSHTGDQLVLDWEIDGMAVNDTVWVYPGCHHNLDDCENKYNNVVAYGGFPFTPRKNPFNTTVY